MNKKENLCSLKGNYMPLFPQNIMPFEQQIFFWTTQKKCSSQCNANLYSFYFLICDCAWTLDLDKTEANTEEYLFAGGI
jgi:hypothetical protein